jgi:hypothetical protein
MSLVSSVLCTVAEAVLYVAPRYCKYARDISQAPWTIGSGGDDGDATEPVPEGEAEDEDETSVPAVSGTVNHGSAALPNRTRKGRSSVEEVICEAVTRILKCKLCRMHPCGREDIDVRMLGATPLSSPTCPTLTHCGHNVQATVVPLCWRCWRLRWHRMRRPWSVCCSSSRQAQAE